jgi:hypothetical protein
MYRDKETALLAEIQRLNLEKQELEKTLILASESKQKQKHITFDITFLAWGVLLPLLILSFMLTVYVGFYFNAAIQLLTICFLVYRLLINK